MISPRRAALGRECFVPHGLRAGRGGWPSPGRSRLARAGHAAGGDRAYRTGAAPRQRAARDRLRLPSAQETLSHRYRASVAPAEIVAAINATGFVEVCATFTLEAAQVPSRVGIVFDIDFCDHFLLALAVRPVAGRPVYACAKDSHLARVLMTSIQAGCRA